MLERFVEVNTADGVMETFVTRPEKNGLFPAVIIYMDIWGVREELYDIARRVGVVGYCGVVPDLYYRHGRRIHFDFRNDNNQTISRDRLIGENLRQILARPQLTNAMVTEDTGALLEFLKGSESVRPGGVGAVGFCMGGRYVICAAARYPEQIIASASLHGTALITNQEDSPHRVLEHLRGDLYCGFGERDPHTPLTLIQEMEQLLSPCLVRYTFNVHSGVEHGYSLPDRDVYDKHAAARDWEIIFAMLNRKIPPYPR
ncbi:MAG: dienelactone hydrolase family protein [Deltaproteobacteria bacterium]|nr:dienelactone hydrolase family protein [Deltaproteobacteria bacterium]